MSLATRCSNCGTVFRVVQDQLLVSEGWVRCGRCREVFNAIENMFDLRKEPSEGSVESLPRKDADSDVGPTGAAESSDRRAEGDAPDSRAPDEAHAARGVSSRGFVHSRPAHVGREPWMGAESNEVVRTSLWPESQLQDAVRDASGAPKPKPRDGTQHDESAESLDADERAGLPSEAQVDHLLVSNARDTTFAPYEEPPDFLARAEKESRWQAPQVRFGLRVAAWVLGVALVLQLTMQHRDTLAARWPVTEGVLQAFCAPFGCQVDAPRRLQALKVENASFTESGTASLYRLQVTMRNVDAARVRTPALDLRLSGPRGETVSRRVITAAELGYNGHGLEGGQEVTLQATLRVLQPNVNGFDVTVFYP